MTIGILLLVLFAAHQPASAVADHYASPDGSSTNPTCPLISPCTLQHAIDIASPGDTINVKSGTYTSEADQVILISKDLNVIGSCAFDTGIAICNRDSQPSTLDGELQRRVISVIPKAGDRISVWLKYLDIVNGNAVNITSLEGFGGGLYADDFSSLEVQECKFIDNYGVYIDSTVAAYRGYGGAMALFTGDSHTLIYNNLFMNNTAINDGVGKGGAIYAQGSSHDQLISNNIFESNNCSPENGSGSQGCAIYFIGDYFQVIDNNFRSNNDQGPDLNYDGASICLDYVSGSDVIGNSFNNENGRSVLMVDARDLTPADRILRNKFLDNHALNVIEYTGYFGTRIMNNWIGLKQTVSTRSEGRGGATYNGIYMYKNDDESGSASIYFNTFALLDYGIVTDSQISTTIQNNIFAEMTGKAIHGVDSTDIIRNLFHNVNPGDSMGGTDPVWENPDLVDPEHGDFHIGINSGAINKGVYTYTFTEINDIDNQVRPFGISATPYDLGADEFMEQSFMPLIFK